MVLYALLAVLLWPACRPGAPPPFVAARAVGARTARALWVVLWLSLALFALTRANRAPGALSGALTDAAAGEPVGLAGLGQARGRACRRARAGRIGATRRRLRHDRGRRFLPRRAARAAIALAIVVAALIWVIGQALGMILATGATDPNSGPLLILLALAYWPAGRLAVPAPRPGECPCARRARTGPRRRHGADRMTPAWLLAAVAALMLAVAAVSAARLLAARPWRRGAVITDTDVAHPLMAVAMAGMLAPGLRTLPDTAWEVIFGLLAAWFAVRVARDARVNGVRALAGGHCAPHLAHSCAMVYMFLAIQATAAGAAGMDGMSGMPGDAGSGGDEPALSHARADLRVHSRWLQHLGSGPALRPAVQPGNCAYVRGRGNDAAGSRARAPRARPAPELGSAALPGPVALRDSVALPGPVALRDSGPQPDPDYEAAVGAGDRSGGEGSFQLSPAVTVGCRVAMGVVMAFMLFIAI